MVVDLQESNENFELTFQSSHERTFGRNLRLTHSRAGMVVKELNLEELPGKVGSG